MPVAMQTSGQNHMLVRSQCSIWKPVSRNNGRSSRLPCRRLRKASEHLAQVNERNGGRTSSDSGLLSSCVPKAQFEAGADDGPSGRRSAAAYHGSRGGDGSSTSSSSSLRQSSLLADVRFGARGRVKTQLCPTVRISFFFGLSAQTAAVRFHTDSAQTGRCLPCGILRCEPPLTFAATLLGLGPSNLALRNRRS